MRLLTLLFAYQQAKRWQFSDKQTLQQHQQTQLNRFIHKTLVKSPYCREFIHKPFEQWAYMDKAVMMNEFDRINTVGINKQQAWEVARQAETTRDFSSTIGNITVGLSSGTSGQRGIFLVSPAEQARWAGIMLAKMLPQGLLKKERVALLLRANSQLYKAVKTPLLSFQFFDLFSPTHQWQAQLQAYQPTIIVAPAQVLLHLARQMQAGKLQLAPKKVISGAEVLTAKDKAFLQQVFAQVDEVYQATEGFLASTCSHGKLHLNEPYIIIEKQWLDDKRFVPVITDFSRHSQPIIRYRLNDILKIDPNPCQCGNVATVIEQIEGRCDDSLILPSQQFVANDHAQDNKAQTTTVFADVINRCMARLLPIDMDYELIQTQSQSATTKETDINHSQNNADNAQLSLYIADGQWLSQAQQEFIKLFASLGVATDKLQWQLYAHIRQQDFTQKKRHVWVRYI